jgi:hypothetical protein
MKSHADKSSTPSTSTVSQRAPQPFVARKGDGSFFAPARQSSAPGIQPKMIVNAPGDAFEQEADKAAATIMRMSAPTPVTPANEERLQRHADERIQRKDDEKLQKVGGEGPALVSADVQSGISEQLSGGQPLGGAERHQMEPRLGADFSRVRVHTDGQSAALNSLLRARAFTFQNHIFFARDEYQPGTSGGQQLLAHELTHTIQQGAARTTDAAIQRAPAKAPAPVATSSEVVNLASGTFSPSQRVHDEIEAQADKGLAVRVIVKGLTDEGQVGIRADRNKNYSSIGKGSMPLLNPWTQQLGGMYVNFVVTHNEIKKGYASLKPGGGDTNDWMQAVQRTSSLLGGLGLKVGHLPTVVNKFDAGKLTLGVSNLKVEVGGFVDALLNLSLENTSKPKVDATGDVKVKGIAEGQLKLDNTQDKLAGEIALAVNFKAFSGAAKVKYNPDGTVDVGGKAAYDANKLSGEIQFVATDLETANAFAKDAIKAAGGKDKIQDAPPPAPVPAPKAGKKQRGLAATGQLAFNLTTWFAGTVNVVADAKGDITVIGKIAPPGEIVLFKQRDWDKELIKFEAKAYYGIPVVGNLNLFANVSLHALASLGPAKLYQIEILGTYSTDPEIQKSIQISGSFNISAYAGLRLRAEGGAGIEIVSHDLKFGVGVNADVGVKAYADARPTIGFREPGEFYVSGTIEMVAQPMLGLSGDFFIELETPWWSPLSDDKWVWPLFSKEWPLTDPIGLKAVVKEYVLGSGKVPEIELKPPEFDPSKFMTNMVDRTLPDKSSGKGGGQGAFKDDGTVPPPVVPPKKPEPKKADTKPGKKGAPPRAGKSGSPDPKATKDQASTKLLQEAAKPLAALKGKGPLARSALNQELAKIKSQVSGLTFDVQRKGAKWAVSPKVGATVGKPLDLDASGSDAEDVDRRVKFAGEAHTIRIHADSTQVRVLMASGEFKEIHDELTLLRKVYLNRHPPADKLNDGKHAEALAKADERFAKLFTRKRAIETKVKAERDDKKRAQLESDGLSELENALNELSNYLERTFGKAFGPGARVDVEAVVNVVAKDRGYRVKDTWYIEDEQLGIRVVPLVGGGPEFLTYSSYSDDKTKGWSIADGTQAPGVGGFKGEPGTGERVFINAQGGKDLGGTRASHDPPGLGGKWNIRGHLVGRQFGGPGDKRNIVAMTWQANQEAVGMVSIENDASNHMAKNGAVITYRAKPEYGANNHRVAPPEAVTVEVDEVWPNRMTVKFKKRVDNV